MANFVSQHTTLSLAIPLVWGLVALACSSEEKRLIREAERLIRQAEDANPRVRADAVGRLIPTIRKGNVQAQEVIFASWSDTNSDVREVALLVAKDAAREEETWIRTPRSIELVARRLRDDDSDVQRAAAAVLGAIKDPRSVEPLLECLGAGSPPGPATSSGPAAWTRNPQQQEVLHACARGLGELRDARAFERLLKLLLEDPDPQLRAEAAEALGGIGDGRALWPLIGVLEWEGDVRPKGAVVAAITKMNQPLLKAAASRDLLVVAKAYRYFLISRIPEATLLGDALLSRHGTLKMAEELLASKDPLFEKAAREWARSHGFGIQEATSFTVDNGASRCHVPLSIKTGRPGQHYYPCSRVRK